jgi:hypothetical protein
VNGAHACCGLSGCDFHLLGKRTETEPSLHFGNQLAIAAQHQPFSSARIAHRNVSRSFSAGADHRSRRQAERVPGIAMEVSAASRIDVLQPVGVREPFKERLAISRRVLCNPSIFGHTCIAVISLAVVVAVSENLLQQIGRELFAAQFLPLRVFRDCCRLVRARRTRRVVVLALLWLRRPIRREIEGYSPRTEARPAAGRRPGRVTSGSARRDPRSESG